ncbi:MAG: hypothetical protein AAGA66_15180 [Bacteroidota bacterium]
MKNGLYASYDRRKSRPSEAVNKSGNTSIVEDNRPFTTYQRQLRKTMESGTISKRVATGIFNQSKKTATYSYPFPEKEHHAVRNGALPTVLSHEKKKITPSTNVSSDDVCQLARDKARDDEKLGRVYDILTNMYEMPDEMLEKRIYSILGGEVASNYIVNDQEDEELVNDKRFVSDDEVDLAKPGVVIPYRQLEEHEKNARLKLNKAAFRKGQYFHIHNPEDHDPALINERMIINARVQHDAGALLAYIADGWDNEAVRDWRSLVLAAKFLGMNREELERGGVKYDKVVIYYNRSHRKKVKKGVMNRIPEWGRVGALSAFYNRIAKGIGVGEQIGDHSFTALRARTLNKWIVEEAWDLVQNEGMSKRHFIKVAQKKILSDFGKTPFQIDDFEV